MPLVHLRPGVKAAPQIRIKVGHSNPATYRFRLQLPGKSAKVVGTANEIDLGAIDGIKGAHSLKGAELEWDIRVVRMSMQANEQYSVRVRIEQNGQLLSGGFLERTGKFDDLLAYSYFDLIEFA